MTRHGASALSYAVHPRVVARYLGQILLILAALNGMPLIASLLFREYHFTGRLAASTLVMLVLAYPMLRLRTREQLQVNEAMVIVSLAFILSPLFMLYPLKLPGIPFIDTAFEAVSAVTTTGLSTLSSLENLPRTFLFTRAWMQWYGGLGIVVLSVALLMRNQMAARRLTGTGSESVVATARTYARRVLRIYLLLTLFAFLLLFLLTGEPVDALLHVMAAVSTGGFSPHDDSLAAFGSWPVEFAVISLALFGAVPLTVYYAAWHEGWRKLYGDVEVRALLALTLMTSIPLCLLLYTAGGLGFSGSVAHGLLQGISAQTTAGFSSLDIASLNEPAKLLLIVSMFVGGGMGSTAGGVKILRLLLLLRLLQLLLQRSTMPAHAVTHLELEGKVVGGDDIQGALLLIALFFAVVVLSWLAFVLCGFPVLDSLFEVVSATGTVGLSTGITAEDLPDALKLVLGLDMLLGRLEIVALLVLLYPRTWLGRRMQ